MIIGNYETGHHYINSLNHVSVINVTFGSLCNNAIS